jgi:hypothetical protein
MDRYHDGNGRLTGDQQPVLHAPILLAAPSLSKPVGGGGGLFVSWAGGGLLVSWARLGLTSLRASTAPTAARSTHACR